MRVGIKLTGATASDRLLALDMASPAPGAVGRVDVVGLGLRLPGDLTFTGAAILAASSVVYCLEPRAFYRDALAPLLPRFIALDPYFDLHPLRSDALREAARVVVERATLDAGVAFALGGHPTVAAAPVQDLLRIARQHGVGVRIHPGVSSLDHVLAEIGLDPGAIGGLQVVRGESAGRLDPRMAAVILCPGYAVDCERINRLVAIATLARDLMAVYGRAARFLLYSMRAGMPERVLITADELTHLAQGRRLGEVLLTGPIELLGSAVHATLAGARVE